jgi:hypothetical protein
MKTKLMLLALLTMSLFSCISSRYATIGAYESDDVYLSSSDTYISDFALVDDEVAPNTSIDSTSAYGSSDDYYDPNYIAPSVYTPNSTANNWQPDPWNNDFLMNSGFGNYSYGSFWNPIPAPMMGISWTPYGGYMANYSVGLSPYYMPSWGFNPYNNWYTPYYSPYYYSGWAYGPSYNNFAFYAGGMNDLPAIGRTIYGPRNTISAISGRNSSYSSSLFYNGSKRDLHSYVNELETAPKPSIDVNKSTAIPSGTYNNSSRPSPADDVVKPDRVVNSTRPVTSQPSSRPNNASSTNKPSRDNRPIIENERANTGRQTRPTPQTDAPARETPRTMPRTEPSRSSGNSPAPSRSGGGSTGSPRRK